MPARDSEISRRSAGSGSAEASHSSVLREGLLGDLDRRVEADHDLLGHLVRARVPDVLDRREVLVRVRGEQLALAGLDEAADHRLLQGVRQLVGLDDRLPGLRLRLLGRAGGTGGRRVALTGGRPVTLVLARDLRLVEASRPPRAAARTPSAARCRRPAPRWSPGRRAGPPGGPAAPAYGPSPRRRAPRPAGGRCRPRRTCRWASVASVQRVSSASRAVGSAYSSIASFTWRCSDCTTPMSDSLPMPDRTRDR